MPPFEFDINAKPEHNRVGAVIVFKQGTDLAKAQKFIDELINRGIIQPTQAQSFDDSYGGPVWYIP